MPLRALKHLFLLFALTLFSACASTPAVKSAETYYKEAEEAYQSRDYDEAIKLWKKVKETYSSVELSTKSELKIADAHYDNKAYIEAAAAYDDFRKLHPSNEKAAYALFRLGLSNYYQIAGIDTDQTAVKNAVANFDAFISRYPKSEHVPEAREKREECLNKELDYEIYVGSYYLRTGKYESAAKRFSEALTRFPGRPREAEALYYLGKAYLKGGEKEKGAAALKKLAGQYPQSPWNVKGAELSAK